MHVADISEKLKELSKGANRSATARLLEIFDQIEQALKAGVRRKDIYKTLIESGFEITFASFELALHRIRKKRRKQNKPNQEKIIQPVPTTQNIDRNSNGEFSLNFPKPPEFKRTRNGDKS